MSLTQDNQIDKSGVDIGADGKPAKPPKELTLSSSTTTR